MLPMFILRDSTFFLSYWADWEENIWHESNFILPFSSKCFSRVFDFIIVIKRGFNHIKPAIMVNLSLSYRYLLQKKICQRKRVFEKTSKLVCRSDRSKQVRANFSQRDTNIEHFE